MTFKHELTNSVAARAKAMNDNVKPLLSIYAKYLEEARKGGGGEPPKGGDMDERVAALEKSLPQINEKLSLIMVKLDSLDKHNATKVDLANTELSMLKWCVGTAIALTGLACAITFGLTKVFSVS